MTADDIDRGPQRVRLGGAPVDLLEFDEAVSYISDRARVKGPLPLGVVSINLDHIHYFGSGSPLAGDLGMRSGPVASVEWLNLADGAPLVSQARRVTMHSWPRLAGSDLIGALLDRAEKDGTSIGFLGGSKETQDQLRAKLSARWPALRLAGCWSPSRADVTSAVRSCEIAAEIAAARVDVLIVCLGKPRQELWIDHYGSLTGARVMLAFGAVVDMLAGRVERAPEFVSRHGLEWAWRLALEPKRLAHRYLVQGPSAYLAVRRGERDETEDRDVPAA